MMQFAYAACLLVSIAGMLVIDRRFKLAFWYDHKRTVNVLGAGIGTFIAWDILGIMLGIFFHGQSSFSLPFTLAPEFPFEELLFLTLLCYCTLILYRGIAIWRTRT
jgi:lycopene cyclase domain-containing protein